MPLGMWTNSWIGTAVKFPAIAVSFVFFSGTKPIQPPPIVVNLG